MFKGSMRLGCAGLLLVSVLCWATDADARRRKHYVGAREAQSQREDEMAFQKRNNSSFSVVLGQIILACGQQAAELRSWPFDAIAETVRPDAGQRTALEELRGTAAQTADKLVADCPGGTPPTLSVQLEEAQRGMETAIAALKTVLPVIKTFYGALDDEQKARLLAKSIAASLTHEKSAIRGRTRNDAYSALPPTQWGAICGNSAAALRDWEVTRIERNMGLSETQRIAFYEMVASSMKAGRALIAACPTETPLTPAGRMETLLQRLEAVHQATVTIHPA